MKKGNDRNAPARREYYAFLRESGYDSREAGREMGVSEGTARHYEMVYKRTHEAEVKQKPRTLPGERAKRNLNVDYL